MTSTTPQKKPEDDDENPTKKADDESRADNILYRAAILIATVGGLFFGMNLGVIPLHLAMCVEDTSCDKFTSADACHTTLHGRCSFNYQVKPSLPPSSTAFALEQERIERYTSMLQGVINGTIQSLPLNSTTTTTTTGRYTTRDAMLSYLVQISNGTVIPQCQFGDYATLECSLYNGNDTACGWHDKCAYDFGKNKCGHSVCYKPYMIGIYASASFAGGVVGFATATPMLHVLGLRRAFLILCVGVVAVSCVLTTIGNVVDNPSDDSNTAHISLLLIGRFLSGMGTFACNLIAPLYFIHASPHHSKFLTGYYGFCIGLGEALMGALGLIIQPTSSTYAQSHPTMMRIHAIIIPLYALCFAGAAIGLWIPDVDVHSEEEELEDAEATAEAAVVTTQAEAESATDEILEHAGIPPHHHHEDKDDRGNQAGQQQQQHEEAENDDNDEFCACLLQRIPDVDSPNVLFHWRKLLLAVCHATAAMTTGITPIVQYAPIIASQVGFDAFMGNFILSTAHVVGAAGAPLVPRIAKPRSIFIGGCMTMSLLCFVMACFISRDINPKYDKLRTVGGLTTAAVFSAVFECTVGCFLFYWSTFVFPRRVRKTGSGMANVYGTSLGLVQGLIYPICVMAISGGPSGDQTIGTSTMFFIFGGVGLFSSTLLLRWLVETKD